MSKSRRSLCLSQQLHSMTVEEEKDKYLNKQQELIDALTDEVTELYTVQDTLETKLDRILAIISDDPENVEDIDRHLQACLRKNALDELSEIMKSWNTKVENVSNELQEFKEFVENDNLIIEVKDLLKKLKESCDELQSQIEELTRKAMPPAHLASLAAPTPPVYVKSSFLHNRHDRRTQENHC